MKRVIVTGAHGFLGRYTAVHFKHNGYEVIGLGHGHWGFESPATYGIDDWIEASVDFDGLSCVTGQIDCVVHCAGGSSVGHSIRHPAREFQRTVDSTFHILEYLRLKQHGAKLIYISSAAVYGDQPDTQLSETIKPAPISPYGFYKKIAEDLCESYAKNFHIPIAIVRFFSIYGPGLQKQLLWDGCTKLCSGEKKTNFYGTGNETRDWLHVEDATELIYLLSQQQTEYEIFNGGSGKRVTVKEILSMLVNELQVSTEISMGNECKIGDPKHYWSDPSRVQQLGWEPQHKLEDGLREYVAWFMSHKQVC